MSTNKAKSNHHFRQCFHDGVVGRPPQILGFFGSNYSLQVGKLHNLPPKQCQSDLLEYVEDSIVEDNVIILHLLQIADKLVHLLFTNLQTVVQFLIHYLSQLKLL